MPVSGSVAKGWARRSRLAAGTQNPVSDIARGWKMRSARKTPSGLPETTSTTRPSTSLEKLYSHFVPGWKSNGALPRRAMNSSDVISRDAALDEVGYAWWISVVPRLP